MDAKTPYPFELEWTVKIGPLVQHGRGLLPASLSNQRGLVNEFLVRLPNWTLTAKPHEGIIEFDGRPVKKIEGRKQCSLVWFRRMEKQLATVDKNTAAPHCLWYGVGLESNGTRIGFKLFEDGRFEEGVE